MQVDVLTYNIHGLPWALCPAVDIGHWLEQKQTSIVCLQEVFTDACRNVLTGILERAGYTVLRPRDAGPAWLSSGLLTAIHRDHYTVIRDFFQPYMSYAYTDTFANKGFHAVLLRKHNENRPFYLVNTHVQSDWEFTRRSVTKAIRRQQAEQIIKWFEDTQEPVLVVGDLNQETSLHPYLRVLHPPSISPLKKITFFGTGEDLDHVAWLPLQWGRRDCTFCGIYGPQLLKCVIHQEIPWSDHSPVYMKVYVPRMQEKAKG